MRRPSSTSARQAAESAPTDHGCIAANADIAVIFARNGKNEAAEGALREQTPTNRRYEMDTLLDACAKSGEYGAVRQLLEQLPTEDLNDRPQHALRALRLAICGRNYGPCW